MDFSTAATMFRDDRIRELSESVDGLRFLKLRSLSRKAHLAKLFQVASIAPRASSARSMFEEAFNTTAVDDDVIGRTIAAIYNPEREERRVNEPELVNQLYRSNVFDWGGLHQNSLESTIVNNYVKKIRSYDQLSEAIENELHHSMRGYVLCSWYNHWTSIIIEDIFRDHPNVLPAVSLINKVDFFVNDVPFDLKVTYLPEGYVKDYRRESGRPPEITLFKQWARYTGVPFNAKDAESRLLPDLWNKATDHPSKDGQELVRDLFALRQEIVRNAQSDPSDLIRWLYENQGMRRFDASNRLFVVLVDSSNFFESWKLKRARPLLASNIIRYLDEVNSRPGRVVKFTWEASTYSATSDAIIITRPQGHPI